MKRLICAFLCLSSFLQTIVLSDGSASKDLLIFQHLFDERRKEHQAAVQTLMAMPDSTKQQKMITLTLEKVFQVLSSSQEKLRLAGYVPGNEFPEQEDVRDALSQTLETTCLLGEVLLHLPSLTHKVLDKLQDQHKTLLAWGVFFTAHSSFLSENTRRLVHLMTQELGLAERDPDYINPYANKKQPTGTNEAQKKTKARKKKSFKKGPTLSRHYGDL
ncbi:coiled-coil domain-containing protein 134 [Hyalella azteca]|uniref:Coiled-coil domain-containing protein 134 n=1 Tax=Hyalella azteca TaxID=294128 RepID=A0A8B7N131_HYAAZ|nr:coiled-coil domain-containing protein 134 [Hyalella azteca]